MPKRKKRPVRGTQTSDLRARVAELEETLRAKLLLHVVDAGNLVVRKITPAGLTATLAGMAGVPGYTDGTGSAAD